MVRWSGDTVMKLAGSFQDLKLNSKETSFVVDKITSSMEIVDVSSIPQLVHSLLLFAAKVNLKLSCFDATILISDCYCLFVSGPPQKGCGWIDRVF